MMKETDKIIRHYLSFKLGEEVFAISVYDVLEVLDEHRLTKVPNSPDYIKGVLNFRGEILPIIDTKRKISMSDSLENAKSVIIVLDIKTKTSNLLLGALADGVQNVMEISEDEILPVPVMSADFNTEFISGMLRNDDKFIMFLDIHKVFNLSELEMLTSVVQQASV